MSTVNQAAAVVGATGADGENVSVMHPLPTAGSPVGAHPIVTGGIAPVEVS
ncbi:hypothetical protein OCAE111667_15675 [Occultella aeris]|uniref:Uncharacterized protein n=1 Tax=Occultella aeris TaxID=2761496 RepID=A0A7M4DMU5_9MICO|nr:hypothetical protein [Occultella aeris]VZO38740.1 hypothetical protein HALOF300_03472 [Occultella aeris]